MLANPIEGPLHPLGWVRPPGNIEMQVTRDCAGHRAANQGCALDIGNGRADGKVLAMQAGRVVYREDLQGIIRIDAADGSRDGYAHMLPLLVKLGDQVLQGQQIGEVGDAHDPAITNFSGAHLHVAHQNSANGPEVDLWPLLAQNSTGEDMLQGKPILQINNRQTSVLSDGTRFRPSPGTTEPELLFLPAGEPVIPYWLVDGESVGGSTRWYGTWKTTVKGIEFGYVHEKLVGPLTPIESTGHSDADLAAAKGQAAKDAAMAVAAAAATVANKF